MHFVTCNIALNGEQKMIVNRSEFHPVSWPELEIIRFIHGEDAVRDVKPFVAVPQTSKSEKERLRLIYGNDVVENIFPGKSPSMELDAPGVKAFEKVEWNNPIEIEAEPAPKQRPKETTPVI